MNEKKHAEAVSQAGEAIGGIIQDYGKNFSSKIGDLNLNPDRERIFILEDLLSDVISSTKSAYLDLTSSLISSIDEDELIKLKKASTKPKE